MQWVLLISMWWTIRLDIDEGNLIPSNQCRENVLVIKLAVVDYAYQVPAGGCSSNEGDEE